jgi:hypothetical protein
MVEHQPSKLDTWVRFPSPAFLLFKIKKAPRVAALGAFLFHRKLRPMKQKTLREDVHSREAGTCRKRPRETPGCAKAHSFLSDAIKNQKIYRHQDC